MAENKKNPDLIETLKLQLGDRLEDQNKVTQKFQDDGGYGSLFNGSADEFGMMALAGAGNAVGGVVGDPLGELFMRGLGHLFTAEQKEAMTQQVSKLGQTQPVQSAMQLAKDNPRTAQALGYGLDLADAFPGVKAMRAAGSSVNNFAKSAPTHVPGFYSNSFPAKAKGAAKAFGPEAGKNFVTGMSAQSKANALQGISVVNQKEILGWSNAANLAPSIDKKLEKLKLYENAADAPAFAQLTPAEKAAKARFDTLTGGNPKNKSYTGQINTAKSYVDGQLGTQYSIAKGLNEPAGELLSKGYVDVNVLDDGLATIEDVTGMLPNELNPVVASRFANHVQATYTNANESFLDKMFKLNNTQSPTQTQVHVRRPRTGSGASIDLQGDIVQTKNSAVNRVMSAYNGKDEGVIAEFRKVFGDTFTDDDIFKGTIENFINASKTTIGGKGIDKDRLLFSNKEAIEYALLSFAKKNNIQMDLSKLPELDSKITSKKATLKDGVLTWDHAGKSVAKELGGVNVWNSIVVDGPQLGQMANIVSDKHDIFSIDPLGADGVVAITSPIVRNLFGSGSRIITKNPIPSLKEARTTSSNALHEQLIKQGVPSEKIAFADPNMQQRRGSVGPDSKGQIETKAQAKARLKASKPSPSADSLQNLLYVAHQDAPVGMLDYAKAITDNNATKAATYGGMLAATSENPYKDTYND